LLLIIGNTNFSFHGIIVASQSFYLLCCYWALGFCSGIIYFSDQFST
jgi:hypothetical protein